MRPAGGSAANATVSIPLRGLGLFRRPALVEYGSAWEDGFNPLAGIRAFQTLSPTLRVQRPLPRFNPLAGIRAFQTPTVQKERVRSLDEFQSPCGD